MPPTSSALPRLALVADTDSRWKWGTATAAKIGDVELQHFLIDTALRPSDRQLREAGVDPDAVTLVTIADLPAALEEHGSDIALVSLPGGACQAVLHAMASATWTNRPIVITGYVGVVYEKIIEGLLLRTGSDIVLANSGYDARTFTQYFTEYGADPAAIVESPLPYLSSATRRGSHPHPYTVTFAAQPSVPASARERNYVIERLVQHARLHPDREVILKLRGMPGEQVTHAEPYPYSKMVERRKRDLPPNFSMVGGPMSKVLHRTDLMVTVSSTAAVEAIQAGIATAVLTDFGISDRLGTPHYAGSGCLTSFDDIDGGAAPTASREWALDHGLLEGDHQAIRERVAELLAQRPLPPLQPFYNTGNASFYLPRLLASYGLAPDGQTITQGVVLNSVLGKVIKPLSKAAYRFGMVVVAPLLRKLGAL